MLNNLRFRARLSVVVDRLRPCTSAELLAFHCTQTKGSSPLATDAQTQQGFIDERAPINPTAVDPSRTADEGEHEDERDDEKSEATQINEDREAKGDQDGRNSKRVTGTVTCNRFATCEFIETL